MSEHPPWCLTDACTAYAQAAPSLRRAHRGGIARIETSRDGRRSTVTTMLIQDAGDDRPQLVLTAAGWAHTRMVELGTAGMQQLLANLGEQLAAAQGKGAPTESPAEPDRMAESITDRVGA